METILGPIIRGFFDVHPTLAPILACALVALLLTEQWLGATKLVQANSTLQLVFNTMATFSRIGGAIYKLGTGKAILIPAPAIAPSAPPPPTLTDAVAAQAQATAGKMQAILDAAPVQSQPVPPGLQAVQDAALAAGAELQAARLAGS